ncbi:SDR family NAD(P)-dependent oxidoreductase [Curtobacterium sp. MCPF17_011]|uniref:NmrA family NAD(P)-binding protein n=1 Tax=Curtobacterium sp. MCPF17_011 TaxID=2175652 RepID=UPI000DA8E9CC|nr:NmrA family NAD(P)-binding protein [Curtobacterium sp. MCPF17_011]PZF09980.1 SDR family NAD(P)-dependent oxidoreductase [Curtobacterium sp. MCPF17_011]
MILVTTGGKVGSEAARLLAGAGQETRLLVRDRTAHEDAEQHGVQLHVGDLDDPSSIAAAVQGVKAIILVTSPSVRQETAVIDAAVAAGVGHVVKITADSSPDSPIARRRDHWAIEQALIGSAVDYTLLRANAYMQNFFALAPSIASGSRFSSPAGDGRIGMVDARDVAAVAATVAADPKPHSGKSYRLSGPASLSYDDVAETLTSLLGREVTHDRITVDEQEAALVRIGLPAPVARANAQALGLFAEGDSDWVSDDVQRILRRPATPFAEFAGAHLAAFDASR